jgi:hypothetical protein
MSKNFKAQSRGDWEPKEGLSITAEQIGVGALQRIADATEVMAQNYVTLQNDRDRHKRNWEYQKAESERMARRIAALQGVITKMKRENKR